MLNQNQMKELVAKHAIEYIKDGMVVGVGTGSTVKFFIDYLAKIKDNIQGAISSSESTTLLLKQNNIPILDLNSTNVVDIYIDGADEITQHLQMIKGGGAALTKEKIIASCAKEFICIVDESKLVNQLGTFPLPIEVIPIARSYVAREMLKLGGVPNLREGVITENGNYILDIYNLIINEPIALEYTINNITGVVTNGLFAKRSANMALIADKLGNINKIKK